jgi:hypothetical protein
VVQQLVWGSDEGTLVFRTEAPVFGLGEGAPGLDRRGSLYPMQDGWGAANRPICGSRISVPFLIGADGWALFLPDLRNRPGVFHAGTSASSLPLRVFLIVADEPAQIVAEYSRLIGRVPMPPKWTLGYMQSHRTLAGPEEVLQVARTFRDKQLPCDALIYLGTGYCPAGWNTGHGSLQFNPKTFDRPQEIIEPLHELQFKVVLHVNHASRNLFGASMAESSENPWHIRNYWSRHSPVYALGVDGWWPRWSRKARPSVPSTCPRGIGTTGGLGRKSPAAGRFVARSIWPRCRSMCVPERFSPSIPCASMSVKRRRSPRRSAFIPAPTGGSSFLTTTVVRSNISRVPPRGLP